MMTHREFRKLHKEERRAILQKGGGMHIYDIEFDMQARSFRFVGACLGCGLRDTLDQPIFCSGELYQKEEKAPS